MTAVATIDRREITALLKSDTARARITPMLRGVEYERVIGEVYLAVGENPDILKCSGESIVRAVARVCSWGLTVGETAHLVPYGNKLIAIQDYKGKIELILAAGGARAIDAQVVYEKEFFEHEEGTNPFVKHIPARRASERGVLVGAYAIADHGPDRKPHIKYMAIEDVDAIRLKCSKQWKQGPCPPWYAMKTAVHQLAKLLPKNAKLAAVLAKLDEDETDELDAAGPVATIAAPEQIAAGATRCICDVDTGEVDPNCPTHGDHVGEGRE